MTQYRTGGAGYYAAGAGVCVVQPMGGGAAPAAEAWYTAGGAPMPVAAYQPIGAADLAASYVNLANPGTYDAVPVVAPTWDAATGWIFASSKYLNTGIVPPAGGSMIARFSDIIGLGKCVAGVSAGDRFYLFPRYTSTSMVFGYSGALSVNTPLTEGTQAIAANACYANGVAVDATTGTTLPAYPIVVGALGSSGSPSLHFEGNVQAIAIYNATLTAAQVAAVHDALMQL